MGCLSFIFVLLAFATFGLGFFITPLWATTVIFLLFALVFKKK